MTAFRCECGQPADVQVQPNWPMDQTAPCAHACFTHASRALVQILDESWERVLIVTIVTEGAG